MTDRISRRRFVAAAAGAAVTGSLLQASRAVSAGGPLAGKIRRAVMLQMVKEKLSVVDKFKLLKDLGFEGVEIRRPENPDPKEVVKARDATGLPVHGITNASSPDLRGAIDLASLYGAETVLVVAGRVDEKTPYDENWRKWQELLRGAIEHAEKNRVRLLVEFVWNNFLLSPMEVARFVDEVQSPQVGMYFDSGNIRRYGWPEQWLRILGRRVGKVHIKECRLDDLDPRSPNKALDAPIGEGDCNWAEIRKALSEIGYSGWATAEGRGGDRAALADIHKRMARVLDLGE